ncbi:hypothetical protein XNC1_2392 [Xenorhabdus nematophila ATCC 19061]|uniref:Uncharacterized protein n=1 Tax=Xenorhabdus nematophila (strain ATCC 19061 / DSM 3370 / CCUG 14189 / LMG 1036 / NCIMB 9965 / AN6) TaxID=406817 RepID=D3VGL5_XENNA|nr:hypothetical protein XNC1_2392 [Xenorhabdus nematophila ATCC 19061]
MIDDPCVVTLKAIFLSSTNKAGLDYPPLGVKFQLKNRQIHQVLFSCLRPYISFSFTEGRVIVKTYLTENLPSNTGVFCL